MKRLTVAIIILCLCLGGGYLQHKFVDNYFADLSENLRYSIELLNAGDAEGSGKFLGQSIDEFHRTSRYISALLGDENLSELEESLGTIRIYIEENDFESAVGALYECAAIAEETRKSKSPKLSNIM